MLNYCIKFALLLVEENSLQCNFSTYGTRCSLVLLSACNGALCCPKDITAAGKSISAAGLQALSALLLISYPSSEMLTVSESNFVPKSEINALQFGVVRVSSLCLCLGAEVVFHFAEVGESLSAFPRLGGSLC